jgi:hypothetical protein
MSKKMIAVSVLSLVPFVGSYTQTLPRESLRGLHGVFVHVLPVGKDVEAGGLSTTQVESSVKKALRNADIEVFSEPQPADGSANLAVVIDIVKHPQGPYIYAVEVSLLQQVHLARTGEAKPFPAQTWGAKAIGLTSPNRTGLILEPVIEKVNEFAQDYVAVNKPGHK